MSRTAAADHGPAWSPADGHAPELVAEARAMVRRELARLERDDLCFEVELVTSELVTNALLHGGGCRSVQLHPLPGGVRIEVADVRHLAPVFGLAAGESMTGRGLKLVASLASGLGVEQMVFGKVVWAELTDRPGRTDALDADALLAEWDDDLDELQASPGLQHVVLGEVPTDLLLAAKYHVDNLVREFTLAASGALSGMSGEVVPELTALIDVVVNRFAEVRDGIKRQAVAAAVAGRPRTLLALDLPAGAADAGQEYLRALDAVDDYCRAARLLTLETPPQHWIFRRWYVTELVTQLRALTEGRPAPPVQPFEGHLLAEVERMAGAQRAAERSARLYTVARVLVGADSPEAVATAVLDQGVAALGGSGGGVLLATQADRLLVPGTVGYDERVIAGLRSESIDAVLPAAVALRTGEGVWVESPAERDERFPDLVVLEPSTASVCAVPLEIEGRRLGALRFSFSEPKLFDEDERRFVLALADQTAQALARTQLQKARLDASVRLQRSLLPPSLPDLPGVDAAARYHPFGDGVEVGGDFYDLWRTGSGTFGLAIGDVVGTGPEAAATTALARFSLRALTLGDIVPQVALRQLNEALVAGPSAGSANERFCTAIVGALAVDGAGVRVTLASGGHPFPWIRRRNGAVEEVTLGGLLLGIFDDIDVAVAQPLLGAGDTLVLFTDGVIEARSPQREMFGLEGVRRVLGRTEGSAQDMAEALEEAVVGHVGGELADDLAILAIQAAIPMAG